MERIPARRSVSSTRIIAILLLIAAIAVIAVGIVYFTVVAGNLPSFMGRVANSGYHRNRRGIAAVVLGVVLLIAAVVAFSRSRQSSS
jgi:hypothetical protein